MRTAASHNQLAVVEEQTYSVVCQFQNSDGTTSDVTEHLTQIRESPTKATTRTNKQGKITGFELSGFDGEPVISGDEIPEVGDACGDPTAPGKVIDVTPENLTITIKICISKSIWITIIIDL